eukprot:SAG11_NODE_4346_length_1939_cov_1.657609_2_plen_177_part_00
MLCGICTTMILDALCSNLYVLTFIGPCRVKAAGGGSSRLLIGTHAKALLLYSCAAVETVADEIVVGGCSARGVWELQPRLEHTYTFGGPVVAGAAVAIPVLALASAYAMSEWLVCGAHVAPTALRDTWLGLAARPADVVGDGVLELVVVSQYCCEVLHILNIRIVARAANHGLPAL